MGEIVRSALGARAKGMDEHRLQTLIRWFVAAGRAEVRMRAGTASDAANAAMRAKSTREWALRALAERTAAGYRSCIPAPSWRNELRGIEQSGDDFRQRDEVIGYGLSFRRRGGEDTDEKCVTVLVDQKLPESQLAAAGRTPLPREIHLPIGPTVAVDVVEAGDLTLQIQPGTSIGPDGNTRVRGTIGAFAVEDTTGVDVALTAMHVAEQGTVFTAPAESDDPLAENLGTLLSGTIQGVDAAMIRVEPPAFPGTFLPGVGEIRGWRPAHHPDDRGARVRSFGAASGLQQGFIIESFFALPNFDLDPVLLVDIESSEGDSGAAIVDDQNLVLGLLVGEFLMDGLPVRIYSHISAVLHTLGCDF